MHEYSMNLHLGGMNIYSFIWLYNRLKNIIYLTPLPY